MALAISCLLALPAIGLSQGRSTTIQVPDPTLGLTRSIMAIPAGWHGQAHVDRSSDKLGNGNAVVAATLASADGRYRIVQLPVKFWTYNASRALAAHIPGDPLTQQNVALGRFTSTTDLLTRSIVPALGLAGQLGAAEPPSPQDRQGIERMKAQMRSRGLPSPILDLGTVTIRSGEKETTVFAMTNGANAGSPRESTWTEITLVTAPAGQSHGLLQAFANLPKGEATSQWLQADAGYYRQGQAQQADEQRAINNRITSDTQRIVGMGRANVDAIQRQGEARHSARLEQQQRNSDSGALFRGYLSNSDTSFKWCGPSIVYTVNSATSPGQGYRRCE